MDFTTRRGKVKEKTKEKILIVAIVLMAIAGLMSINAQKNLNKLQQNLDRERYQRMVAEENLNKANTKIGSLESELAAARDKIQSVQTILEEGQKTNSDLRSHLESAIKAKEALETKIEELRVQVGSPQPAPTN